MIRALWVKARPVETVVGLACGYEAAVLLSRNKRAPTLSAFQREHRLVGAAIVGWLIYHFIVYPERKDLA